MVVLSGLQCKGTVRLGVRDRCGLATAGGACPGAPGAASWQLKKHPPFFSARTNSQQKPVSLITHISLEVDFSKRLMYLLPGKTDTLRLVRNDVTQRKQQDEKD
jgi:hypothetical protein